MENGVHFIGLEETMKTKYHESWFRSIAGPRNFVWQHTPPRGRSCGLLLGVNADVLKTMEVELGTHLVVVYGPAQVDDKEFFLTEFAQVCSSLKGLVVIGGNFNILRKTCDKNKPCVLPRWSYIFNSIIESNGLKRDDSPWETIHMG